MSANTKEKIVGRDTRKTAQERHDDGIKPKLLAPKTAAKLQDDIFRAMSADKKAKGMSDLSLFFIRQRKKELHGFSNASRHNRKHT